MPWNIFERLINAVDWTFDRKQTIVTEGSTCLDYVEFSPRSHFMTCGFTQGQEYRYSMVDRDSFLDLVGAPSVGRHFNYHVRNNFPYERIM